MKVTQSRLVELFDYNCDTGSFTRKTSRGGFRIGSAAGHIRNIDGYIGITVDRRTHLAHRLAWIYVYGIEPEDEIDHINGVRSDNRIFNLRLASKSNNMCNATIPKHNTSGVKGVSYCSFTNKWRGEVVVNKRVAMRRFNSIEEAELWVRQKRKELHREFHNHGFHSEVQS